MKIKDGYLLRKVAEENIAIYMGEEDGAFEGLIRLNNTAAYLWEKLEQGIDFDALIDDMIVKYHDLPREIAVNDVNEFLNTIKFALDMD